MPLAYQSKKAVPGEEGHEDTKVTKKRKMKG